MTHPYRLGLIGLGRIAWLLEQDPLRGKPCTHLGAWTKRADVILVAVCDNNEEQLRVFSAQYPDVSVYRDYEKMLAQERLDLLSICAYATERCDMVVAATESNVRGIWCEKAMATSLEEARRMEVALAKQDTVMAVAFMRRWSRAYFAVKNLLQDGAIGRLESINVHFTSNMLHTGTHAFDMLRMWCGEVESVQAWLDTNSANVRQSGYRFDGGTPLEDIGGFALLTFSDGVRASIHAQNKDYFRFEFELLGSEGLIRIGNTQRELWQRNKSPRFSGFQELEQVAFPAYQEDNAWCAVVENLVAAVEGRATSQCTATDGRQALAIALATHVSHHQANRPVMLDEVPVDLRVPSR